MRTSSVSWTCEQPAVADQLGGDAHRCATYPSHRTCEAPGCTTRLSVYNSRPFCSIHDFVAHLPHDAPGRRARAGSRGCRVS